MSEWIDWQGGECPVAARAEVQVRIAFLSHEEERTYRADDLLWDSCETPGGFIFDAYRPVVPMPTFADLAAKDAEIARLDDALRRNGFVPCDIPACNCGSWHARYGLRERLDEIKDDLAEAGHPLSNDNGNLVRRALGGLVTDRDRLRTELAVAREAIGLWMRYFGGSADDVMLTIAEDGSTLSHAQETARAAIKGKS